jgi:hypothetical protein
MTQNDEGNLRVEVDLMNVRSFIPEDRQTADQKIPPMNLWYAFYNDLENRQVELLWTMGKRPLMFVYDGSDHTSVPLDLFAAQNWGFLAKQEQIKEGVVYYRFALHYRLGGRRVVSNKQSDGFKGEEKEIERVLKEGSSTK